MTERQHRVVAVRAGRRSGPEVTVSGAAASAGAPLATHVEFRGTENDARRVFDDLRATLTDGSAAGARLRNCVHLSDYPFCAHATMLLQGGAECVVAVSPPVDPAGALPHTYLVSAVVTRVGTGGAAPCVPLLRSVGYLPFTTLELNEIRSQLPLTCTVPKSFPARPLRGIGLLLTIHHMTDFLPMVEALIRLGASPDTITVIDKEYPYLLTRRVDAHLTRRLGLRVFRYSDMVRGLAVHLEAMRHARRRDLIIDDGGYVLPVLLEHFHDSVDHFLGVVEQTMSGIVRLDSLDAIPLPVFSVAESRLKAAIECYGIADAAIRNLISLLPHEKFEGQPALVLGYGRIGRELANVLRTRRLRVAVYDSDPIALIAAHENGFITGRDVGDLIARHQPLLMVGSAGRGSLTRNAFARIKRSCFLVSVTSRDYEFDLPALRTLSRSVHESGILGRSYVLDDNVTVLVIANGFPINFHYAESLPNKYADLVTSSLLIGACTLALEPETFERGHNVALTNRFLERSGIVEKYYDLYTQNWD